MLARLRSCALAHLKKRLCATHACLMERVTNNSTTSAASITKSLTTSTAITKSFSDLSNHYQVLSRLPLPPSRSPKTSATTIKSFSTTVTTTTIKSFYFYYYYHRNRQVFLLLPPPPPPRLRFCTATTTHHYFFLTLNNRYFSRVQSLFCGAFLRGGEMFFGEEKNCTISFHFVLPTLVLLTLLIIRTDRPNTGYMLILALTKVGFFVDDCFSQNTALVKEKTWTERARQKVWAEAEDTL